MLPGTLSSFWGVLCVSNICRHVVLLDYFVSDEDASEITGGYNSPSDSVEINKCHKLMTPTGVNRENDSVNVGFMASNRLGIYKKRRR